MRLIAVFVLVVSMAWPAAPRAEVIDDPRVQREVQAVIAAQLAAFRSGDADAAFAHAAPFVQEKFGTPAGFMDMVRVGYAPVFRNRFTEFAALVRGGNRYYQHVIVEGADGNVVMAVYPMVKDSEGRWRIAGCYLAPLPREST